MLSENIVKLILHLLLLLCWTLTSEERLSLSRSKCEAGKSVNEEGCSGAPAPATPGAPRPVELRMPTAALAVGRGGAQQGAARERRLIGAQAELLALNTHLREHGAPGVQFGPVAGVTVGTSFGQRTELALKGVHRHFLSDVSHSVLGVESLILPTYGAAGPRGSSPAFCDDFGERLLLGCWTTAENSCDLCHRALRVNLVSRLPVRVVRVVQGVAAGVVGNAGKGTVCHGFRYDGIYIVLRLSSQAAEFLGDSVEQRYLLIRAPHQPPLPRLPPPPASSAEITRAGVGVGKVNTSVKSSSPKGELSVLNLTAAQRLRHLPPDLEVIIGDPRTVTVGEAISRLMAAREKLVASMTPYQRLAVAKLREHDRKRKRLAIDMLHASDDPLLQQLAPARLESWPKVRMREQSGSPASNVASGTG